MKRELRDFTGMLKGWTEDCGAYIEARDFSGRYLGRYEKSTGVTYDECGRYYCQDNDTTGLVSQQWEKEKYRLGR